MVSLPLLPALTLVHEPNAHLVVPSLVVGTLFWLTVVARRLDVDVRFAAYSVFTATVVWPSASILLILHDQATGPTITTTPDGGWDVQSMPDAARALLGIAFGALVPALLAACDRVPWHRWTWTLLAAFPVAYLVTIQLIPPGMSYPWNLLPALAWLTLLPSALRTILESRPTVPAHPPT